MKQIFTKTQAVSVLVQIKANGGRDLDMMKAVDPKHNLFSQSCEELEKKILQYMDKEGVAGVVDDPIIKDSN